MPDNLQELLGSQPSSPKLDGFINTLAQTAGLLLALEPEVKVYSDAVYFNYHLLGLSILFTPSGGYKPKSGSELEHLQLDALILDSFDVFNVPSAPAAAPKGKAIAPTYTTYPALPLEMPLVPGKVGDNARPERLSVTSETTGKDFVEMLGEPDRKGGGEGPSSGSIGIWCEWSKDGIMVEFGGDQARGPQAWERGKDAVWKVMTIFKPKAT